MHGPVEVVWKAKNALRAGVIAVTLTLAGCGGGESAFAQSSESIFSPDMEGTKRATPATMGALEVQPTDAVPGPASITISRE